MSGKFEISLKKYFVCPSNEIYGGSQGFYDYAPDGATIMLNLISEWYKFFARKERMLNIDCPIITPEKVFKASGHVERFTDFLVKDIITGDSFRADHLVEEHLKELIKDQALSTEAKNELEETLQLVDNYGDVELGELIQKLQIRSPILKNELTKPQPYNLMFPVMIGPTGNSKGYLRPETAQGIFVNFKILLDKNQGKLPFAVAQVGTACRNEISPRSGLLRVREFKMAEIEHFLDPEDKSHEKFNTVAHLNINMFTSPNQVNGKSVEVLNLGEAVRQNIIANETLGYFMGRIYLFLMKLGIKPEMFRFRQHMPNEMAHYACDCWDAECLTSHGWIECVGCADRSAYDLMKHTEHSGVKLVAQRQLKTPKKELRLSVKPVMSVLGKALKKNGAILGKWMTSLSVEDSRNLANTVEAHGKMMVTVENVEFQILREYYEFEEKEVTVNVEEFVPNVIEPSFGLGRIFYSMLEQNFKVRPNDPDRTYFTIPAWAAPYQFSILPLSSKECFVPLIKKLSGILEDLDILCFVDTSSASIGKRYARSDTIGIPFGITVDFNSVNMEPASVTVRERDSTQQIRVNVDDFGSLALQLVKGLISWEKLLDTYPLFEGQEIED